MGQRRRSGTWNWKPNPAGTAVSYLTAPLTSDTTVIGAGSVTLWVKSSTPDVDLQATVSEVTPDGHETFVQNGYLRASERKLATRLAQHLRAAEHDAGADPEHAGRPTRSRCRRTSSSSSSSRSTTRATPTAPAPGSG